MRRLHKIMAACVGVGGLVAAGLGGVIAFAPPGNATADYADGKAAAGGFVRAGSGSLTCNSDRAGKHLVCHGWLAEDNVKPEWKIPALADVALTHIAVGSRFGIGVDTGGNAWAWGANDAGQFGTAPDGFHDDAVKIGHLDGVVRQVVAGEKHACVLVDRDVWCAGNNEVGQVSMERAPFKPLTRIEGVEGVSEIGTSGYDGWAVSDGGVWAWGNNKWKQAANADGEFLAPTLVTK